MKSLIKQSTFLLILFTCVLLSNGCKKDQTKPDLSKPFAITDYFVAGTLKQKSGSKYTSVFFIQLLEDNKALFINSSSTNLVGTYTLTETELVFEVTGGNARIAKFALDRDKQITTAYYKALTTEYDASVELLAVKETNELAGKTFKGEEFKMGQVSNRIGVIYRFNKVGTTTFGSGLDAATIDNTANNYTLIGSNGFKYVNGSTVEMGFISKKKLTVFRSSGLFYYGRYDQQ